MNKRVFGRHLNRDTNERKALFKSLMTELVLHERITTTEAKARAIRSDVEKLITKAKRKGKQAEYILQPHVSAAAVKKIITDLGPRFADRPGGYTRVIKMGNRFYDNAAMAIIELVDRKDAVKAVTPVAPVVEDDFLEPSDIQEAEIVTEAPKKAKAAKESKSKKEPKEKKSSKVTKEKKKK